MSNTYWLNGKYVEKEDAYVSPLTHTLHYGLGAFEGVRSYASEDGKSVNIFRLKEHTERSVSYTHLTLPTILSV